VEQKATGVGAADICLVSHWQTGYGTLWGVEPGSGHDAASEVRNQKSEIS
jgi:hypothetical protein